MSNMRCNDCNRMWYEQAAEPQFRDWFKTQKHKCPFCESENVEVVEEKNETN
jgi:Zn finger protein HypA/HybF involved in hydrogenase expression